MARMARRQEQIELNEFYYQFYYLIFYEEVEGLLYMELQISRK